MRDERRNDDRNEPRDRRERGDRGFDRGE